VDGAFTPPLTPPSEKFGKQPYYQPPLPMYPDGADYNPSLFSPYSSAYTRLPFAPLLPNHVDSALALPATPPSGRFEKRQLQFIHPDLFAPDYRPRFIHPMWPDEYDPVVDDKDLFSDDERWKQPFEKR
jgi:hypothetical protein